MSKSERTDSDRKLAECIQEGDRAAFKALFQRYAEALRRFAVQYTESREIAEELVQDLFFEMWKNREQWSPTVSVKSYLYTSVRNLALDYLKHEQVVETWKQEALPDDTPPAPDERLHRNQLRQAVHETIDGLPERRRHVFKLSRQHNLTYREIAKVLDISVKTVETHMSRAFRDLREQLAPHRLSDLSPDQNDP